MKPFIINTFIAKHAEGNPTAVYFPEEDLNYDQYLQLAQKQNVPVTAFIKSSSKINSSFSIRYFSTVQEIPACGHATLAAAKLVFELFGIEQAGFSTIEHVVIKTELRDDVVFMMYPVYTLKAVDISNQLLGSLHLQSCFVTGFCTELKTLFIELDAPGLLRSIQPDFRKMVESSDMITEVVITSISDDPQYDFLLRSFCPWIGIDEDPVTGSVHSVLAGYWAKRFNKTKLSACQASVEGGVIIVETADNFVWIGGRTTPALL